MQGFNMGRYVPPESEGVYSANQVSGKHALGARARKAGQGILTVRFEMPFAVWCSTCPKPTIIGQGVRFNAEKKKVGNYYSTTVWSFRMKHVACGGWIEIHTDPKNTDYVVIEGGKRRDTGEDKVREGDLEIKTEAEKLRLQEDAFAALEVKIDDRKQADTDKARIEELYAAKERDWDDPYSVNKRMRKTFRTERKGLEKKAAATEELKSRMSLAIDLVEESEEDRQRAALIEYGRDVATEPTAGSQPLFKHGSQAQKANKSKSGSSAQQSLRQMLTQNTRSTLDVFSTAKKGTGNALIPGIKRKRDEVEPPAATEIQGANSRDREQSPLLVSYDSD